MSPPAGEPLVAVITGCSSGIGENLALAFAARGVTVVATARRVESLAHLTKKHDNIIPLPLELGDLSTLETFRDAVAAKTGGRVDILVNNAGMHLAATAVDMDVAEAERLFVVNVFAVMRLCQLFFPLLRRSPRGRIVQLGSISRDVPTTWQCAYNASKAALSQYTKTLRLEVRPFGVEVIEVVTGYVRSNILHHGFPTPDDSLYLPLKADMERILTEGIQNGMPADEYAAAVVDRVLRPDTSAEIWDGKFAWTVELLVRFTPLWFVVSADRRRESALSGPHADAHVCRIGSSVAISSWTSSDLGEMRSAGRPNVQRGHRARFREAFFPSLNYLRYLPTHLLIPQSPARIDSSRIDCLHTTYSTAPAGAQME